MRYFNRISLSTPESVELDFALAGIGNRVVAFVIDYLVLTLIWIGAAIVWSIFSIGLMAYLQDLPGNYSQVPVWLTAIALLGSFVIYAGYFVFFEVFWQGQSPGKRFAQIRVVRDDGRPIGLSQAVMRSLLRSFDDFLGIGLLLILFSKREKRLGDWAAGTLVVQEDATDMAHFRSRPGAGKGRSPVTSSGLYLSEEAKKLAKDLPEISDLSQLIPDDFVIIGEYLQRRVKMAPRSRTEKSMELAQQLKTLINLEVIPPNTTSDHFLEAVYLAYQRQTGRRGQ